MCSSRRGRYVGPESVRHRTYRPKTEPDPASIVNAVDMMAAAKRPVLYTGGGIINAGPEASRLLRELVHLTGFPITSTLMGLGAFPASDRNGWACWACTAPTKPTSPCMIAI